MKLRNKKTGNIIEATFICETGELAPVAFDAIRNKPITLAELNGEWEDYEEPKGMWAIGQFSEIYEVSGLALNRIKELEDIGNTYNTEEEAERAVEKLKAWKRLKDKGFVWQGWEEGVMDNGMCVIGCQIPENNWETDVVEDLDLLFGGEE